MYINDPTAVMKCAGVKAWSKLDAELVKLVKGWPVDAIPNNSWFYRWARLIRGSVKVEVTAPVCDDAVAEVLKTIMPRLPSLVDFNDYQTFREADETVLKLVSDLDEHTRLRLAGIYWRWGQVVNGIERELREERWAAEKKQRSAAVASVQLGAEHKATIDWFRRKFNWTGDGVPTDAEVASEICRCAFLIPGQIMVASVRALAYSKAEGLSVADARRSMIIAAQRPAQEEAA